MDAMLKATQGVAALPKFKHVLEDGRVVASQQPFPNTKATEMKYYACNVPIASMHRPDGKRIAFISGFFSTDLVYDQQYLDNEIADGHGNIRHATEEEIFSVKMREDPHGTMEAKVKEALEPAMREQLEREILAKLVAGGTISADTAQQLQQVEEQASISDPAKIAGTETVAQKLQRLKGAAGHSGATIMTSQAAPIKPVSTADLGGAEGSGPSQIGKVG